MKHCALFACAALLGMAAVPAVADTGDVLFSETFDTQEGFDRFTVLNNNGDEMTWEWAPSRGGWNEKDFWARCWYNSSQQMNDWLITPEVPLEAGKIYRLRFRTKGNGSYNTEVLTVAFGQGDDPQAYTVLEDQMQINSTQWMDKEYRFTIAVTGLYRVGLWGRSPADQYALDIDEVEIAEWASAAAPQAVTGLTATAAAQGALSCELTFTLPSKRMNGEALTALNRVEIARDSTLIATLTSNIAPGATISYLDNTPANGLHRYTVTPCTDADKGIPAEAEAFVGKDAPDKVGNVTLVDNGDHYALTWTAPTKGQSNHYFTTEGLLYDIYLPNGYAQDLLVAEGLTDTFAQVAALTDVPQELTRLRVKARNEAGESDFENSNVICVGTPYTLPIVESFANGNVDESHYWWRDALDINYWNINTTGSSDNDGGCMAWVPYDEYDEAWICSGKIDMRQTVNPKLTFDYNIKKGSRTKIQIELTDPQNQTTAIGYVDGTQLTKEGWAKAEIALAPAKASPYVMVKFHGMADDDELLGIDNIKMLDYVDHNLSVSLSAPATVTAGQKVEIPVTIHNYGLNAEQHYRVMLHADSETIDSLVAEPLASMGSRTIAFTLVPSAQSETMNLAAEVMVDGDQVETDNLTPTVSVEVIKIDAKTATNLTAEMTEGGVTLHWDAPHTEQQTVTDDFESYTPWLSDEAGPWSFHDGDDAWSLGLGNYTFPNMEEAFAWIVFNRNGLAISEYADEGTVPASQLTYLDAHSGEQYLAAFTPKDDMGEPNADDWLISPRLTGDAQTVSLWIKSLAKNATEPYELLYSTTDTRTDNFKVLLCDTLNTTTWTQVEAQLPDGALYFAFRRMGVTELSMAMFLDDATYTTGDGQVKAYRVYRNGTHLATTTYPTFADPHGTADSQYQVSVVYNAGESPLSEPTSVAAGINNITFDSKEGPLYNLAGQRINRPAKGVYVKQGKLTIKN